jgi:predicted ester cyclase/catechol 2,3-dioxygenase-like lactoylglutathione lyase family enzyme
MSDTVKANGEEPAMRTLYVALRVANLERAIGFYTALGYEVVGGTPETEAGSPTLLRLPGDVLVALGLVPDPSHDGVGPGGLDHLVVQVADVAATLAHLAAREVVADEPGSPAGSAASWSAWVTDPDGYRIKLVQWPESHTTAPTRPGQASVVPPATGTLPRTTRDVVEAFTRGHREGDRSVLDLAAVDLVNHAAGPQGREGLRRILDIIETDLGPTELEQHHLVVEGDLIVQHVTLHGTHRASTMPLLTGLPVTGRPVAWRFIHLWRVADGMLVEHWACRDDMGLLEQLRSP